jgi:hypothetical protein
LQDRDVGDGVGVDHDQVGERPGLQHAADRRTVDQQFAGVAGGPAQHIERLDAAMLDIEAHLARVAVHAAPVARPIPPDPRRRCRPRERIASAVEQLGVVKHDARHRACLPSATRAPAGLILIPTGDL